METVREVFETSTVGTMAVTQAVLPQFRRRNAGVIMNVTSSVTLQPLPLLSVYIASKAAINAFTESLTLELQQFNVRANLVIPGRAPETHFGKNAQPRALDVAQAVWRAVNDASRPVRMPAGAEAVALAESC